MIFIAKKIIEIYEIFLNEFVGSSGDEESDSSRGGIPTNLDVPRGLQVIPLSPTSDFYYNKDNSDKRVSYCCF